MAELIEAILTGADLREAKLESAKLQRADLQMAKLAMAKLKGAQASHHSLWSPWVARANAISAVPRPR